MALLKTRATPPGGWTYHQAETDFTIKAENEDALISQVMAHREYKGLPISDRATTKKEIERQICTRLGYHDCKPEGKDDKWVPRDGSKPIVTMGHVLAFSKAAFTFVASGFELAPMEEVRRRAAICRACPLNQPMTGCSCNTFYKAIEAAVSSDRRLEGLHVCKVCDCSLVAKVNLTEAQVVASNDGRTLTWPEQECWQKSIMDKAAAPV